MKKKLPAFAAVLFLVILLAGCAAAGPAEPAATPTPTALDLRSSGLTDADLAALAAQTGLTSLDIRQNDLSIPAVQNLLAALPNCSVLWSIPIGSTRFDSDSVNIILPPDAAAKDLQNLTLFQNLTSVDAAACKEYAALKAAAAAMPQCAFSWSIDLLGKSYPANTTGLDLTGVPLGDPAELLTLLQAFPQLDSIDLTGQTLSFETMDSFTAALPDTAFLWDVPLAGTSVNSSLTEADISGRSVANVDDLVKPLSYLPNLTKLVMCNCGPSNEEMERLIAACPNVKFVWMIRIGAWEMRTDVKAFSKGNRKTFDGGKYVGGGKTNFASEDLEPLKYCTDLIALDLGHGNRITDLSILQYLPKLRFLIVAMNKIPSIEDLKYCPDLEYLEIFQNYISDWTPLLSLTKLTHLNCCSNYAKGETGNVYPDYTVLKQMPQLQRLWILRCGLTKEQLDDLQSALPNTYICASGSHSTDNGWRDNDLYKEMQGLFNLPIAK